MRVLSRQEVPIHTEDDVIASRRAAQTGAQQLGFDSFATAAVTTATSELSRNMWRHAGGGVVVIQGVHRDGRDGIVIEFRDAGPGIADLKRALAGGYSTAGSLGLGLSGSKRLVDSFTIDTQPGRGTSITITKWRRF